MSDDTYTETTIDELPALVREPRDDGTFSFDPISPVLGDTELSDGTDVTIKVSRVRDRDDGNDALDVAVKFGKTSDGMPSVHFDSNALVDAAITTLEERGDLEPEGGDE